MRRDGSIQLETLAGRLLTAEFIAGAHAAKGGESEQNSPPKELTPPVARGRLGRAPRGAVADRWRDEVLEAALQRAANLQKQKIPILIMGETGVGKDHLVRKIHADGQRKGRPLVLLNCAAIPRELISSELFGYAPGVSPAPVRPGILAGLSTLIQAFCFSTRSATCLSIFRPRFCVR